jgi:Na+/phosphate symporter
MAAGPERRSTRRLRLGLAWALSALVVGGYYLIGGHDDEDQARSPAAVPAEEGDKLDIFEVVPSEATPGSAVQVRFTGGHGKAVRALLSASGAEGTKAEPLEQLSGKAGELVVRVPASARPGRHKLRLQLGENRETRSKPYDLRIEAVNRQRLFRSVLGGLALLVFGLRTMSRGSREYAGQRSQGLIAGIARRTSTAGALGLLIGTAAQFTTTAAGLVVGLIESHLLTAAPAAAVLLGAQVGAAAAPSLLGLASTAREGLLLVTIGVIWLSLADDRRGKALGQVILGCGLLFYGLHLLRTGFEPLVADPQIMPYIDRFQADHFGGLVVCVATGVLLSAVLQGPAPVFALVLGLAQATGRLDLQSALAILAGTGLGASIGTAVVAWPFGPEPRRLARLYFVMALAGTLVLAASVDLWAFVGERLVSGHSGEVAYGKKVLLPQIGGHLATAFVLSQLAVAAALGAALPLFVRLVARLTPAASGPGPLTGPAGLQGLREGLGRVLGAQRKALLASTELSLTGHRTRGTDAEHALADARDELEALFGGALQIRAERRELARLRQAALATLQLQRALEDLLRQTERTTERAMALSPAGEAWELVTADAATLQSVHGLLLEGMDAVAAQLASGAPADVDAARAREIRMNAIEAQTRQELLAQVDRADEPRAVGLRLNNTDLVNAYENVGNHLYRLQAALAAEVEQDTAAE